MTARAEAIDTTRKDGKIIAFPMLASEKIYKGCTVLLDGTSKYAQTNDGTTITLADGDIFAGICVETMENTGSNGDEDVRVSRDGTHKLPISDTLTQADVGKPVYINNTTDDAVATVTAITGAPQVQIGVLAEVVGANEAFVEITPNTVAATAS